MGACVSFLADILDLWLDFFRLGTIDHCAELGGVSANVWLLILEATSHQNQSLAHMHVENITAIQDYQRNPAGLNYDYPSK